MSIVKVGITFVFHLNGCYGNTSAGYYILNINDFDTNYNIVECPGPHVPHNSRYKYQNGLMQ